MNRAVIIICLLIAVSVLTWFFPLFHVVRRDALREAEQQTVFDAADHVKVIWTEKLPPVLADAADAALVLAALRQDPQRARNEFGRSVGIGRSSLFLVRGRGTIMSADNKAIGVSLDADDKEVDVSLVTGLLFGNTIRDATGLIDGDDFPSSQEFNQISGELNRTVETTVLPRLKAQAKVGDTIEFVGCGEVTNLPRDITPLKLIPLEWKIEHVP